MPARLLKIIEARFREACAALPEPLRERVSKWGGLLVFSVAVSLGLHLLFFGLLHGVVVLSIPRPSPATVFNITFIEEPPPFRKFETPAGPRYLVPTTPADTGPEAPAEETRPVPPPSSLAAGTAVAGTPELWKELLTSPGKFSFFGLTSPQPTTVFLIDVSGSMLKKTGPVTRLRRANEEIMRAIASLEAGQTFNIVLFADRVDSFRSLPVAATRENKIAAFRYLESEVDCGGGTNLGAGLAQAMAMKPDSIFLLSDGESTTDTSTILSQVQYMRKQSKPRMMISSVGFYLENGSPAEQLLKDISINTGGRYIRWNKQD